jgi:hypothetical protein
MVIRHQATHPQSPQFHHTRSEAIWRQFAGPRDAGIVDQKVQGPIPESCEWAGEAWLPVVDDSLYSFIMDIMDVYHVYI